MTHAKPFSAIAGIVLLAAAVLASGGCAAWSPREQLAGPGFPSMEVDWPALELTQAWDGGRFVVPADPVVVPPEALEPGLPRWRRHFASDWHVRLPDGRRAIVWTGRDADDSADMSRVTVYRPDGTLAQEQWNVDGRPNAPGRWTAYEADGRTPRLEVSALRGRVNTVTFYESGRRVRQLLAAVDTGQLVTDSHFRSDGTEVPVHPAPVRTEPG